MTDQATFDILYNQIKQGYTLLQCLPLLEKVTDFDQGNRDGKTLLMKSLRYSKENLQLYLIERTKNIDHFNIYGCNALIYSLLNKSSEKVQLILADKTNIINQIRYDYNPVMVSLLYDAPESVQLALLKKTNLNEEDIHDSMVLALKYKTDKILVILELIKRCNITIDDINLAVKKNHSILVIDAMSKLSKELL